MKLENWLLHKNISYFSVIINPLILIHLLLGGNAPNLFHAREQYRGISFAIGAKETWSLYFCVYSICNEYSFRTNSEERAPIDYSYFAPDCLHPSQKLHALMARALWNNLLQPVDKKTTGWTRDPPLLCPTSSSPYLSTRKNSQMMNMTVAKEDYVSYLQTVRQFKIGCYM